MAKGIGAVLLMVSILAILLAIQSIASLSDPTLQDASIHFGGVAAIFFIVVALVTAVLGIALVGRRTRESEEPKALDGTA